MPRLDSIPECSAPRIAPRVHAQRPNWALLVLALSLGGLLACSSLTLDIPPENTAESTPGGGENGSAVTDSGNPGTTPTNPGTSANSELPSTEEGTATGETPSPSEATPTPVESTPSPGETTPTPLESSTPAPLFFKVKGTITNLRGEGLVLSLNDGDQLVEVPAGATSFSFPEPLENGSEFSVLVDAEPSRNAETCTVNDGTGTIIDGDNQESEVVCRWRTLRQACTETSMCEAGGGVCPDSGTRRCAPVVNYTQGGFYTFEFVSSGAFMMGSPTTEIGREPPATGNEGQASVELTRDFYLGTVPVRQLDWLRVADNPGPSWFEDCGQCPVERVTWWSALWFANQVSELEGLPPCFDFSDLPCEENLDTEGPLGTLDCGAENMPRVLAPGGDIYACVGYRLPTEAEWEYAMRAGTTGATWAGELADVAFDCDLDNQPLLSSAGIVFCGNADTTTVTSGSPLRVPSEVYQTGINPWGFFSALGNVFNWTWDVFDAPSQSGINPVRESAEGTNARLRVLRGGSFDSNAQYARAAARFRMTSTGRDRAVGFRLARSSF